MNKKVLLYGAVFGLISPIIGISAGLQISPVLGNILAFPVIILAYLTDKPFGTWGPSLILLAACLSVFIWTLLFGFISRIFTQSKSS
ncbi:hypothetical protein [Legionella israelensis]|uniref:hypothetical protein n=1 Tax=Legionella israelensis TaxID=454 RepID=UPI00163D64CF|nr:hypothetical protein [Legionella israelensis]